MTSHWITCGLIAALVPLSAAAQPAAPPAERLSLEAAIRLAVENNRSLQTAKLEVEKAEEDLAVARKRRLPSIETNALASQLLTPVNFSFPRGAFGEFPGAGPIPATDTLISTPRRPNVFMSSEVTQPLSQLVRINLAVRTAAATRDVERERTREQQLAVVNSVKRLYFSILQTDTAIAASDEAIALYRELARTLTVRVAQRVSLKSEALDVDARLAKEEFTRTTKVHARDAEREQLNVLLGRDVRTMFETEAASQIALLDIDLRAAQDRGLDQRPDVRQARLKVEQAELDRRLKKAERIPEVGVALSYTSNFNIDVLPRNLATLGVKVKWEPLDWGRRGRELAAKGHAVNQARLAVRESEDRAILDINDRFRKLTEARDMLRVTETSQAATREKLRVKTTQYQIQAALLADVLSVRAELADSNDRYQQALSSFWTAKADFDRAVGEE